MTSFSLQQLQQQQQQDDAAAAAAAAAAAGVMSSNKKRKAADALGRLAATTTTASSGGRGAVVGWTTCPLCMEFNKNEKSSGIQKKFALGRGIAAHLHAVHAPWKGPSKAERRQQRRRAARQQAAMHQQGDSPRATTSTNQPQSSLEQNQSSSSSSSWEPTEEERAAWDARVLELVRQTEEEAAARSAKMQKMNDSDDDQALTSRQQQQQHHQEPSISMTPAGLDRTGKTVLPYRASLPRFLQAAADGKLDVLQAMLSQAMQQEIHTNNDDKGADAAAAAAAAAAALLQTRDRHGSTAEHWAAGEGHVDCLRWLVEARLKYQQHKVEPKHEPSDERPRSNSSCGSCSNTTTTRLRRRDGKTPLHYAARNGQMETAAYLWNNSSDHSNNKTNTDLVNAVSGDGTTPLHLACYGGHLPMVQALHAQGAHVDAANAWGCTAAHWVAMSKVGAAAAASATKIMKRDDDKHKDNMKEQHQQHRLAQLCDWLAAHGVDFTHVQSQGHSPLHKAAQHQNIPVLKWMAQHYKALLLSKNSNNNDKTTAKKVAAAAQPDQGGHTPWDILQNVGGDPALVEWLAHEFGGGEQECVSFQTKKEDIID